MTQHHRNRPSNSFEQVMLGLEPGEVPPTFHRPASRST